VIIACWHSDTLQSCSEVPSWFSPNIPPNSIRREAAFGSKKGRLASALVGIASVR
jgi:hypothetical protein